MQVRPRCSSAEQAWCSELLMEQEAWLSEQVAVLSTMCCSKGEWDRCSVCNGIGHKMQLPKSSPGHGNTTFFQLWWTRTFCQNLQRMIKRCLSEATGTPNYNEPPRAWNHDSGSSVVEGRHCQGKGGASTVKVTRVPQLHGCIKRCCPMLMLP